VGLRKDCIFVAAAAKYRFRATQSFLSIRLHNHGWCYSRAIIFGSVNFFSGFLVASEFDVAAHRLCHQPRAGYASSTGPTLSVRTWGTGSNSTSVSGSKANAGPKPGGRAEALAPLTLVQDSHILFA
jgi:hypothetical protein